MSRTTTALVVPELNGHFELQPVLLDALQPDEAIVEIHASGVCHTDLACAHGKLPCEPYAVLGHEGAGVVIETGSAITHVSAGDKVLLSFSHCGTCPGCQSGHPAYCYHFNARNFGGKRPDGSAAMFSNTGTGAGTGTAAGAAAGARRPLFSSFFGQSSFARHAIVHRSSLVRLAPATPLDTLALLAPLGCGIQTGAGAVLNALDVRPGSSLAVFGVGSVGMAAVMAGKIRGAAKIIAVDLHPARLTLAQELGATHGVRGGADRDAMLRDIRAICDPALGVDFAVDCTGVPAIVEVMIAALGMRGRAATVGAPGGGAQAKVDIMSHLTYGKEYVGCSEGDSNPAEFLPYLIDMHTNGSLSLEKLVTFYDIQDYEKALGDAESGKTIKAVLKWS